MVNRYLAPNKLTSLTKAANTVVKHLNLGSIILQATDIDCDGLNSGYIGNMFFNFINDIYFESELVVETIVSSRLHERGYNNDLLLKTMDIVNNNPKVKSLLLFTSDTGSSSDHVYKELKEMLAVLEKDVDIIVTDHHEVPCEMQHITHLLNPKDPNDKSGADYLCGCSILYQLLQEVLVVLDDTNNLKINDKIYSGVTNLMLPYVGLTTLVDMMPMNVVYNRVVVKKAAELYNSRNLNKYITQMLRLGNKITYFDFNTKIGPYYNCANRYNVEDKFLPELLTWKYTNNTGSTEYLNTLNDINNTRKQEVIALATEIEENLIKRDYVLVGISSNPNLTGLIAGRLTAKYHLPVFILTDNNGLVLRGSSRCNLEVNLLDIVHQLDNTVVQHAAGHQRAFGLTIDKSKLEEFANKLNELLEPIIKELPPLDTSPSYIIKYENIREIGLVIYDNGPYGVNYPEPIVKIDNVQVTSLVNRGTYYGVIFADERDLQLTSNSYIYFSYANTRVNSSNIEEVVPLNSPVNIYCYLRLNSFGQINIDIIDIEDCNIEGLENAI